MPQIVRDPGERPLVLHSRIDSPIEGLPFLAQSLLFAELSMIAYNDQDEAGRAADAVGFGTSIYFDRDGAQGYRFENDHDCVVVCRGTEPHEWNDVKADANVLAVVAETVGRVHGGFKREVDDLWPMLEAALTGIEKSVWFCGHSLGGAMAVISAIRCVRSRLVVNPKSVFTFGSPRVGDRRYVRSVALCHYRWVNNNDIVTRVPPVWLGYRHAGEEIYMDYRGRIRDLRYGAKRRDRWLGFLRGIRRGRIDHFSDHSIHRYIENILAAART
jgi:triacylglycerol lipase